MSEIRRDRTTGEWVIIAPERGLRPQREHESAPGARTVPARDPTCPFCPGNEAELPGVIEQIPAQDPSGWQVRVIPNKYPALHPRPGPVPDRQPGQSALEGYGFHEVIIESPRHDADLVSASDADVAALLSAYHRRYIALSNEPRVAAVIVFRNHRSAGGASIIHPHSQLVALAMRPPVLQARAAWARAWHDRHGQCVLCAELALEQSERRRLVEDTALFAAFVPFAAICPFELWIVPKRHQASFAETDANERAELAAVLRASLRRFRSAVGDRPYNFVMDSAQPSESGEPHLHWRLRVEPRLVIPGGFELGSFIPINPSAPEADAAALRRADTPQSAP